MSTPTERELLDAKIREAHGIMKDLKRTIREARQVRDETIAAARDAVTADVAAILERAVDDGLTEYKTELADHIDEAVAKVMRTFEELSNSLTHGNPKGRGESVFDLMERTGFTGFGGPNADEQAIARRRDRTGE